MDGNQERKLLSRGWLITGLIFVCSAVATTIISRVTNLGINRLLKVQLDLELSIIWLLSAALLLLVVGVIVGFLTGPKRREEGLGESIGMLELDDTLMTLLPELVSEGSADTGTRRATEALLSDAANVFESVLRMMILRPIESGEWIQPWASKEMAAETMDRAKFYVGSDESSTQSRGVAGEAYVTQSLQLVRFSPGESGEVVPENSRYMVFDRHRSKPPYNSFAAVPILNSDGESTGVLCVDSQSSTVFDDPDIQEFLSFLCDRIGTLFELQELLTNYGNAG